MNENKNKDFLWGVATSAFQIEGSIQNDMTDWENRGRFRVDGKNPLIGQATDHWNRWEEDFELLRDLGVNSYRFSLEWARIEPEPGRFDRAAIDQYGRMIDRLRRYNVTPMVTLHHFTQPGWFHEHSPWHEPRSIVSFMDYVRHVSPLILKGVDFVVTINEPLVWGLAAYGEPKFPPGEANWQLLMESFRNMLLAHREAYDYIKNLSPKTQVGLAHNFISFKRAPYGHYFDLGVKRLIHNFYNRMIIKAFMSNRLQVKFPLVLNYDESIPLDNKIDFWGVNYYYRLHVRFRLDLRQPFDLLSIPRSSGEGQSDLGWEIYPRGLYKVCRWLKDTGKPIYITENGIAVQDDNRRLEFLKSHLKMLEKARHENPMIRGYFHWSLLDNYEWLEGTSARFGLYHVDYDNDLKRSLKPSGIFYRDYIKEASEKANLH